MTPYVSPDSWPNAVDAIVTAAFLFAVFALPALGYVFMVLDIRTYVRSLRRGLTVIGRHLPFPEVPGWARNQTPRAIASLGLRMPCTEDELLRAYRERVMKLHPDHGGDERCFRLLQADFEEALSLVRAA